MGPCSRIIGTGTSSIYYPLRSTFTDPSRGLQITQKRYSHTQGHPPSSPTHFVLDGGLLVLVQVHLDQLLAVELDTDALADDLRGEHQVLEDGVVHGGQGSGAGPLLLQRVPRLALGLGQDLALADEHDLLAAELLLQLTHDADLDLLEGLLLGHGHVDDDRLGGTNGVSHSLGSSGSHPANSPSCCRTRSPWHG